MVAVASSGTAVVTLPEETQILITREFDAPKHLVYRAYTEPELISQWWSGERGKVTSVEVDLRVGGAWRYVMMANEGFEVAFHGEYQEIVPNEKLVNTEVFEGAPGVPEPADDSLPRSSSRRRSPRSTAGRRSRSCPNAGARRSGT